MLRALAGAVLAGLVAWAGYVQVTAEDASREPAAAPPPPSPSATLDPPLPGPPLWVRYPNPLEGSWTADSGRLTLVIANSRLTLTDVTHYRSLRFIRIDGHRVHVRPSGGDAELATYRWRIADGRLTFRLLERTPGAALRLERLTFQRRA